MKKFYSFVLMAAALLIGIDAWAQTKVARVEKAGQAAKEFSSLQAAINAVDSGETATITLLKSVELDAPLVIPQVATVSKDADKVVNRKLQRITLDLQDFNISTPSSSQIPAIILLKGELNIIGEGTISCNANGYTGKPNNFQRSAIVVCGADGMKTPTAENPDRSKQEWSTLIIGKDVTVSGDGSDNKSSDKQGNFGIALQDISLSAANSNGTYLADFDQYIHYANLGYSTYNNGTKKMWWTGSNEEGAAFGVKIIIKGTVYGYHRGINIVGHINQSPKIVEDAEERRSNTYPFYTHYYPYIKIEEGAKVYCTDSKLVSGNGGIYGGGWCVMDIYGEVYGQTGIYMRAGDALLYDATVYSTSEVEATNATYGANNSGNAIFMGSAKNYAGEMGLLIDGDTKVTGNGGAAIVEELASGTTVTGVQNVTINGGTIEGGNSGAIAVTAGAGTNTTVYGGNITGTTSVAGVDVPITALTDNANTHVTAVTDPETNKTTLVISAGAAPTASAVVYGAEKQDSVKWTGTSETLAGNLSLKELEINQNYAQTLTVPNGITLTSEHVVLGAYAKIIVKAGGKFIVTGNQGIVAPSVDNILIEASESAQGIFLFNPNVNSNRHPSATVQMVSKSFYEAPKEVHQRFGMPVYDGNVTLTPVNPGSVITGIKTWDYAADDWSDWTNISAGVTYTDAEPFRGYMLASNNAKNAPMTYEFVGSLVGNENANIMFRYGWNNLANSYVAPINIVEFSKTVAATVGTDILATIYVYKDLGDDTYTWQPINQGNAGTSKPVGYDEVNQQIIYETIPTEIQPLQAFLMQLRTEGTANQAVDYEKNVYNPAMNIANAAPARNRQINNEMNVSIYNAEGFDDITLIENGLFSNDLDNGFDAAKYMNNSNLKIYAMNAEEPMSIFATDNVEGTFMGIDAQKAGEYTMLISGVKGMEYAIIDMTTGVATLAEEGAKYNFFTEAGRHDYRFEIVSAAKMPTAIENTEVVKSTKGIYTITGQYLGENFEVLPKGMYIVNGVKVIK